MLVYSTKVRLNRIRFERYQMEVIIVEDIRNCLESNEWKKDDKVHEYAVALIEWCIEKRKIDIPDDTLVY